jgi:hypothetical protein
MPIQARKGIACKWSRLDIAKFHCIPRSSICRNSEDSFCLSTGGGSSSFRSPSTPFSTDLDIDSSPSPGAKGGIRTGLRGEVMPPMAMGGNFQGDTDGRVYITPQRKDGVAGKVSKSARAAFIFCLMTISLQLCHAGHICWVHSRGSCTCFQQSDGGLQVSTGCGQEGQLRPGLKQLLGMLMSPIMTHGAYKAAIRGAFREALDI